LEVNLELILALIEESVEFIIKLEYFWKFGNWSLEVQSDVRVTRGQVDNENNTQSQDLNISNKHTWQESYIWCQGAEH